MLVIDRVFRLVRDESSVRTWHILLISHFSGYHLVALSNFLTTREMFSFKVQEGLQKSKQKVHCRKAP